MYTQPISSCKNGLGHDPGCKGRDEIAHCWDLAFLPSSFTRLVLQGDRSHGILPPVMVRLQGSDRLHRWTIHSMHR